MNQENRGHVLAAAYWAAAIVLIGFGALAIFSVGFPFLLLGVVMAVLWPLRARRELFFPLLAGTLGFIVAAVLASPLGCTTSVGFGEGPSRTECANLLGIEYTGIGAYDPPRWPALVAGVASGGLVALVTRCALLRGSRS
jgi:hypothetical protein